MEYISKVLLDKDTEFRLISSSVKGEVGIVRKLLKKNANPNVSDHVGRSALMHAVAAGQTEVVSLLLEAGANVNVKEYSGVTPLHTATRASHTEIIKLLILAGAGLDIVTKNGLRPIDMTAPKSQIWYILHAAEKGTMPVREMISEVPVIPQFAIEQGGAKPKKKSSGKKTKKGKKKGGKSKKKGKKKK